MRRKTQILKKTAIHWRPLIGWILLCEVVGIIGSIFTVPQISSWYATLVKPSFSPPNWVFGPVWIVLYALMGFAAYRIWSQGMKKTHRRMGMYIFIAQLVCNFLWSILFFSFHTISLAFVDIAIMWVCIAVLILRFEKSDSLISYSLLPYLFWVSFAMVLNYNLWLLNA